MDYRQMKEKNLDYFTDLLNETDADEHRAVAQSEVSHIKRFEKILELGDFTDRSILDVGCGIGGFYDFLMKKNIPCDYTGIDINPYMIQIARTKYPHIKDKFFICDIIEESLERTFDFVCSNGPLNLKCGKALNKTMTFTFLHRMYDLATVGTAMTMTSSFTRKPNKETFYYNPMEILTEISKFCVNVRFDHTYLPHDFAVFCYKKDLYDF
ncbi:MAG: class I SAM-dependent methyltransferase [Candidatus Omnitrophota bacterium]